MRVLLTITTLGAGGAERVMTLLADALAGASHQVCVMTLDSTASDFFSLGAGVQRMALGRHRTARTWLGRTTRNVYKLRAMRAAIRSWRADAVVSFLPEVNILAMLAAAGLGIPVVVSERVDPRRHRLSPVREWLRWTCYRRAAALVVQTEGVAEWLRSARRSLPRITVIPNPVQPPRQGAPAPTENPARPFLFAAGRLTHQKGFDILIRALGLLVREGSALDLAIAGEGWGEERNLQRLVAELGLGERVRFIGKVPDLSPWLKAAYAFVLPSRYEGFPNVLLEALACGTPSIAADCPSGPREILGNELGLLVPAEEPRAIADAVLQLQRDPALRSRLQHLGPVVCERYSPASIGREWERLLEQVAR